jgi:KDO2-lipid IV(A) lauroyltransferase
MAMYLEKTGIRLSAIYRPLNNIFLNGIMEDIRKNLFASIKLKKVLEDLKN